MFRSLNLRPNLMGFKDTWQPSDISCPLTPVSFNRIRISLIKRIIGNSRTKKTIKNYYDMVMVFRSLNLKLATCKWKCSDSVPISF